MRIWDIAPGYLNRQSLLGEHRELHGIVSIISNNKKGYSRHPETLRWAGFGWALRQRHRMLVAEMTLRGYVDRSVVLTRSSPGLWPYHYIDSPERQIFLLKEKYQTLQGGRIPLPNNAQQLWAQHKYSVMARDVGLYRTIGRDLSKKSGDGLSLVNELVEILRQPPSKKGVQNALFHMWGYVSHYYEGKASDIEKWSLIRLYKEVVQLSNLNSEPYLLASTALGELGVWLK